MKKNYVIPLVEDWPMVPATPLCGSNDLNDAEADDLSEPGSATISW